MEDQVRYNKINDRLRRVANVLLLNASFTDNIGLLGGKTGIAIFFYRYARYTGDKVYEDYAGELLDEVFGEINQNTPVDFANGLMGIGWGIEYLAKNGYVEADTDEVLAETDNRVYGSSLRRPFLLDSGDSLFGYGLYFVTRLMGREDDERFESMFIKQHIIYLIDDCERILIHEQYKDYNIASLGAETINSFLWFLFETHKMGLFPVKTGKILRCLPEHVSHAFGAAEGAASRALLTQLTGKIVPVIDDAGTKKRLEAIIGENIGKKPAGDIADGTSVADFIKGSWQGLLYGPLPGYNEILDGRSKRVFPIIDGEADWNARLDKLGKDNIGLTGLAGLGLGLLSAANACPQSAKHVMAPIVNNRK